MTNRERYKQAFSVLQSSRQFELEVEEMEQLKKKHRKNIAAAAAIAFAIVIGGSGTVYAADIGGIQEKISMWLYGTKTEVVVTENGDGGYIFSYEQDGEMKLIGGGGVSFDANGNETWLSADEVAAWMSKSANIDVDEDGKVWIYFYDQKIEITDSFDENGVYNLTLSHEDRSVYLEITKNEDGGYSFTQTEISAEDSSQTYSEVIKEFTQTEDSTESEATTTTMSTTYIGITDGKQ